MGVAQCVTLVASQDISPRGFLLLSKSGFPFTVSLAIAWQATFIETLAEDP